MFLQATALGRDKGCIVIVAHSLVPEAISTGMAAREFTRRIRVLAQPSSGRPRAYRARPQCRNAVLRRGRSHVSIEPEPQKVLLKSDRQNTANRCAPPLISNTCRRIGFQLAITLSSRRKPPTPRLTALKVQHSPRFEKQQLRIDMRFIRDPKRAINLDRHAREFLRFRVSPCSTSTSAVP